MGENADDNDDSDDNNADEDGNYEGLQDAAAVMMIGDDVSDNVVMVGWHRQHPASTGILCGRNRHRNLNPDSRSSSGACQKELLAQKELRQEAFSGYQHGF